MAQWKQNSLFLAEPVVKCFVIPRNTKIEKKLRSNRLLEASWFTNLQRFQGARPESRKLLYPVVVREFC